MDTLGDGVAIQRVSWRRPRAIDFRSIQGNVGRLPRQPPFGSGGHAAEHDVCHGDLDRRADGVAARLVVGLAFWIGLAFQLDWIFPEYFQGSWSAILGSATTVGEVRLRQRTRDGLRALRRPGAGLLRPRWTPNSGQYVQLVILQSIFRLAARRRPAGTGKAFTAPVTERWIGRKRRPAGDFYGRCIVGRRHGQGSAGAVRGGWRPPAASGDGREGGRAARREDRRRGSTTPATPGAAEAHLADVEARVTMNPQWPDTPRRQRGGRPVACCLRGSEDTGATSGRSASHSDPDSQ